MILSYPIRPICKMEIGRSCDALVKISDLLHDTRMQWRRSVVKSRGSGSLRSSHQTVWDYTLRQRFPNNLQSRFLTACRRLKKFSFTFHFRHKFSLLMMWNLLSYTTTVLNERMWHFQGRGSKHTLTPPTYFQGVRTLPTPRIYALDSWLDGGDTDHDAENTIILNRIFTPTG